MNPRTLSIMLAACLAVGLVKAAAADEAAWWSAFGDPALDARIGRALAANPGLAAAEARLREAEAQLGVARTERAPSGAIEAETQLAGETAKASPLPGVVPAARRSGDQYRVTAGLGWELDLWGRVRASVERGEALAEASAADLDAARLALAAAVAEGHLALRAAVTRRALAAEGAARLQDIAGLAAALEAGGYAAGLDAARARAAARAAEADLAALDGEIESLGTALAVLEGTDADTPRDLAAPGLPALPPVPADVPASIVARRPDVAATEARLRAADAAVDAARADFYPSIRLTTSAGLESADLGSLLGRPSQAWSIGPSVSVPWLDGGRRRRAHEAALARRGQAEAAHRETTLAALAEVRDALAARSTALATKAALTAALAEAEDAVALAAARVEAGRDPARVQLEAEREAIALRSRRVAAETDALLAWVGLIKATGGAVH